MENGLKQTKEGRWPHILSYVISISVIHYTFTHQVSHSDTAALPSSIIPRIPINKAKVTHQLHHI